MKTMSHNPNTMIKCTFSNAVHKILEPNLSVKRSLRWKHAASYKFTAEQKIAMFDEIMKIHNLCSSELSNYNFKKRYKKQVQKDRVARGYVPKKKTRLEVAAV